MNIKRPLSTSFAYLLFSVTCLLAPITCLAEYTYSSDGVEVTDTVTGLIWRRCSEGQSWSGSTCQGTAASYTYEQALARAKSQAAASGLAWRLPNIIELSSITKMGEAIDPSIDITAFPATPSDGFWSSSPDVVDSNYAWYVNFYNGSVNYYNSSGRNFNYYVRLVR